MAEFDQKNQKVETQINAEKVVVYQGGEQKAPQKLSPLEEYLQILDARMTQHGFRKLQQSRVDRVFHRKQISVTKFGVVNTYCIIKYANEDVTTDYLSSFSDLAFEVSNQNKSGAPSGLFASLIVYSLTIASNSVPEDVIRFLKAFTPQHFSSFEFPVVYELSSKKLDYCMVTPSWGGFYYQGFRKEAERLFNPDEFRFA
ncbi:MAG TPA: hypothetical protein VN843_20020 [Anaerolineales bacterium]|nr:hypothetical protein [Anaerolineales bacterium]